MEKSGGYSYGDEKKNTPFYNQVMAFERELLVKAIKEHGARAYKVLQVPKSTFYEKKKLYNIERWEV